MANSLNFAAAASLTKSLAAAASLTKSLAGHASSSLYPLQSIHFVVENLLLLLLLFLLLLLLLHTKSVSKRVGGARLACAVTAAASWLALAHSSLALSRCTARGGEVQETKQNKAHVKPAQRVTQASQRVTHAPQRVTQAPRLSSAPSLAVKVSVKVAESAGAGGKKERALEKVWAQLEWAWRQKACATLTSTPGTAELALLPLMAVRERVSRPRHSSLSHPAQFQTPPAEAVSPAGSVHHDSRHDSRHDSVHHHLEAHSVRLLCEAHACLVGCPALVFVFVD